MTHLYIEQATDKTEEVNSSIISKLYELAISGNLDNTSDLKGRLHSSTAKEKHVTYLNNNFDELYISADIQYISFDDPDVETYMKRYIGDNDGVTLSDIQTFVASGRIFGADYANPHTGRNGRFTESSNERQSINTFDELSLFTGLTSLGSESASANLTSIQLPASVISLESYCFNGCTNLKSVDLSNIQRVGIQAFGNSGLTGIINLPSIVSFFNGNNYTNTDGGAFNNCNNITEVNLGPNLQNFGLWNIFSDCTKLQTVTGLSSVTDMPTRTFWNCTSLSNVDFNLQSLTSIGNGAFYNCKNLSDLETINIPNLTDGRDYLQKTFFGCTQIKHVVNLGSITKLKSKYGNDGAFSNCTGLLDAVLPETLTEIGLAIFSECSNLRYVKILATNLVTYDLLNGFNNLQIYGKSFGEAWRNDDVTNEYLGSTYPVYVKDELLSQYQSADGWKYLGPNRLRPLSQFVTDFPNG